MAGGPVEDVKKAYRPGPVGIASRSGGMTTEIANLLTTHGIGQSTCVGVGGDPVVGSNFLDLIPLFNRDPETKAVVLFCEPGGVIEEKLAELQQDLYAEIRTNNKEFDIEVQCGDKKVKVQTERDINVYINGKLVKKTE